MGLFSFIRRTFSGKPKRDRYAPRIDPGREKENLRPFNRNKWVDLTIDPYPNLTPAESKELQELEEELGEEEETRPARLTKLVRDNKQRLEEESLEESLSDGFERAYTSKGFIEGSVSYQRHRAMENKFKANDWVRVISGANRGHEAVIHKGNCDKDTDEWKYELYSKKDFAHGWKHWYAWESELELVRSPGG